MFQVLNDLSASVRGLRRRPISSTMTVGVLALGLSAGIAVFTCIRIWTFWITRRRTGPSRTSPRRSSATRPAYGSRPFTVVGVMSAEFVGTGADSRPDVWIPIAPFKDRYTDWARLSEDRDQPWVRAATVADFPLLSPHLSAEFLLDGQTDPVDLVYSKVIPGFFEALGIGVVQGRSFTDADTASAPDVALVNESLARRFFPGQ